MQFNIALGKVLTSMDAVMSEPNSSMFGIVIAWSNKLSALTIMSLPYMYAV